MPDKPYNLTVIGSGPGGYKAAITAAQLGARVALIERKQHGGTCLNKGCIPKNTLLHQAKLLDDIKALNGRGISGAVQGDFSAAMQHKEDVIREIRDNFPVWLRRLGVRVYDGIGSLVDAHHVRITDAQGQEEIIKSDYIVLASGGHAKHHPACKVDGERILTSYHFLTNLKSLPERILCLGGGAISSEFGYLLKQYGSDVVIAEQSGRLLNKSNIPERASRLLERTFEQLGIQVYKNITVSHCQVEGDQVKVQFSDGREESFSHVLVAIGRRPNTKQLGLEKVGIRCDRNGFIPVNEHLQTSVPSIYAVGDVKRGPMTANGALHDGKVAASNALFDNQLTSNYHTVPIVIDSALEIAAVGLTEEMAEDAGFEPDVARGNFHGSPKARGRHDTDGFIEVVHDEETGQMLGGCIVGTEAGEQIQMLTAACQSPRGLWLFTDINYSHPSWCEELEHAIYPYTSEFLRTGKQVFRPGIYATRNRG